MPKPNPLMQFIKAQEAESKDRVKIQGTAYTGGMMDVGWWYPVVVALSGVRMADQVALLVNHENRTASRVGEITATVKNGGIDIAGEIVSTSGTAQGIVEQLEAGVEWQLSIGAHPERYEFIPEDQFKTVNGREFEGPFYHIAESVLREVSVVAIGADEDARMKLAASLSLIDCEVPKMVKKKTTTAADAGTPVQGTQPDPATPQNPATPDGGTPAVQAAAPTPEPEPAPTAPDATDVQAAVQAGVVAERKRVSALAALFGGEFKELEAKAVEDGLTPEQASVELLAAVRAARPTAPNAIIPENNTDARTLEAALCLRAGIDEETLLKAFGEQVLEAAAPDRAMSLQEFMVAACRLEGVATPRTFQNDSIRAAFSTVSVSQILENVANKALLKSYTGQQITAPILCSAADIADFKQASRYRLNDVGDLQALAADGEIQHGSLQDEKATNQLDTYGKMLVLNRQQIYNDDLGGFLKIPAAMGARAARLLDQLFYTRLLANPNFPSTNALFSSANKNYASGATTALSGDSLGAALKLFLNQTDVDGQPIAVNARYLLVPSSLKFTAMELIKSAWYQSVGSTAKSRIATFNPYQDENMQVVVSPYLENSSYTGYSALAWYLFGDPSVVDTFEIGYLRGKRTPTVESAEANFNTLGLQMRVYFDVGIREMDHRGMVKMKGEA